MSRPDDLIRAVRRPTPPDPASGQAAGVRVSRPGGPPPPARPVRGLRPAAGAAHKKKTTPKNQQHINPQKNNDSNDIERILGPKSSCISFRDSACRCFGFLVYAEIYRA